MSALQESRRELMLQLEGLMKLLKVRAAAAQASPHLPALLVHLHLHFSFCLPVMSDRMRLTG